MEEDYSPEHLRRVSDKELRNIISQSAIMQIKTSRQRIYKTDVLLEKYSKIHDDAMKEFYRREN